MRIDNIWLGFSTCTFLVWEVVQRFQINKFYRLFIYLQEPQLEWSQRAASFLTPLTPHNKCRTNKFKLLYTNKFYFYFLFFKTGGSTYVAPSLIVVHIFIKQELALHIKLHATGGNKTKIPTHFFEVLVLLLSFYFLHLVFNRYVMGNPNPKPDKESPYFYRKYVIIRLFHDNMLCILLQRIFFFRSSFNAWWSKTFLARP